MPAPKPVNLFFCYAPEDELLRKELEKHLTLLTRQGYLTSWSGHGIGVGEDWRVEIARRMDEARVILLLVSADFLASDYLYEVELERALARRASARDEVLVLGLLLRPSDWKHGKLKTIEMLPVEDGVEPRAVTTWRSSDEAFARVAKDLRARLYAITGRSSGDPSAGHDGAASGPKPHASEAGVRPLVGRISLNPSEAHPAPAPRG